MDEQELFRWKFGMRIRLRRAVIGLSQTDLAERLGYSNKTIISKIESGKNEPPLSKVKAFADALETTVAYLMGWTEHEFDLSKEEYELICKYRNASILRQALSNGCGEKQKCRNRLFQSSHGKTQKTKC